MRLTPPKYWRVPCGVDVDSSPPPEEFELPNALAMQSSPPKTGHGIAIAAYDEAEQLGLFRWLGVVTGGSGTSRTVEWKHSTAQIWVDTGFGRGKWKAGAFGFAESKIAGYGLHELWSDAFDGMEFGDHAPVATKPIAQRASTNGNIPRERRNPVEVIGKPTTGPRAGVVYVLKSAYGYKVGRTKSMTDRMRTFGVKLPFVYTIPLCAWFEDCQGAERRYHDIFASKRINGEWFDLTDYELGIFRTMAEKA